MDGRLSGWGDGRVIGWVEGVVFVWVGGRVAEWVSGTVGGRLVVRTGELEKGEAKGSNDCLDDGSCFPELQATAVVQWVRNCSHIFQFH